MCTEGTRCPGGDRRTPGPHTCHAHQSSKCCGAWPNLKALLLTVKPRLRPTGRRDASPGACPRTSPQSESSSTRLRADSLGHPLPRRCWLGPCRPRTTTADTASWIRSAIRRPSAADVPTAKIANSSPPRRATRSPFLAAPVHAAATLRMSSSPRRVRIIVHRLETSTSIVTLRDRGVRGSRRSTRRNRGDWPGGSPCPSWPRAPGRPVHDQAGPQLKNREADRRAHGSPEGQHPKGHHPAEIMLDRHDGQGGDHPAWSRALSQRAAASATASTGINKIIVRPEGELVCDKRSNVAEHR